jgi:hypothetical protein
MKQLRQPFYYTRWFNCTNKACKTTLIMRDEFKVENNNEKAQMVHAYRERDEQMSFLRSIT